MRRPQLLNGKVQKKRFLATFQTFQIDCVFTNLFRFKSPNSKIFGGYKKR
jgi:hypothetical protein